jgi:AcrR family transcriptional regulator
LPPADRRRPRLAPKAPRRRLDLEVRREELLAAAFELFVARGYDDVGVEDVARAAGASKGLVYHYFPTKKHLYRAAVERGAALLLERTDVAPAAPPLDRLEAGLDAYFAYVAEHRHAYEALMRGAVGVDAEVAAILDRTREEIARRVLEGLPLAVPSPTVRAAVRGWIGFVEALALRWLATRDPDRDVLRALALGSLQHVVAHAVQLDPR